MANWRNARGIMASDLTEIDMSTVEPFKAGEWVAPLAGLANDIADSETYMRLHNTIVNYERQLMILRDQSGNIDHGAKLMSEMLERLEVLNWKDNYDHALQTADMLLMDVVLVLTWTQDLKAKALGKQFRDRYQQLRRWDWKQ